METRKKRTTKLKLEEIPKVNTSGRALFIEKITKFEEYKKAVKSGIPGFLEEELKSIEKKYEKQGGLLQEDIQNELKDKGWLVKPNTIKHYIQVGQLPRPNEPRIGNEKGAVSLYPINFMRHLNLVRFAMNTGRNLVWETLIRHLNSAVSDYDYLLAHTEDECYLGYEKGFFQYFWIGIDRIDEGLSYAKEAVKSAFKNNTEKLAKYTKRLSEIEKLRESLINKIGDFQNETQEEHLLP